MAQKKTLATTDPTSDDAPLFDLDPPVGHRVRSPRGPSIDSRRRSQSSIRSESDPLAPPPCAIREIPGEDCALQRFIVWAAVKRNRSVRIAPSDRLKCPLLLCGEQFDDHETMLRHLTKCQHLKTGEYVCYDCMKIERFNDGKCRCCLGQPTKRRRIINMARNFFSTIGNRSRRGSAQPDPHIDVSIPPPSYDSVVVDLTENSGQQQEQQQQEDEPQQPQLRPQLELNGREIHELDSRQMLPTAELDPINYDTRSVDIPMTDATPGVMAPPQTSTHPNHREPPTRYLNKDNSMPPPSLIPSSSGGNRPSLALDTHVDRYRNVTRRKYLSPSSSLRSTKSSQNVSPVTPWSSSSGSSGTWTMASSVDTEMTSPITPFTPNDIPPASQLDGALAAAKATTACPDDDCNYMVSNMSELPGDDSLSVPRGLSDPFFFSFDPKDNYSWMQSVDTELSLTTSVNMMFTDSSSRHTSMPSEYSEAPDRGPDTRTLVETAWGTLQEHVSSSIYKLEHVEGNTLAQRLRTLSPKAVALNGLSSLRKLLQGNDLTDPLDYVCFIHLIYALSFVVRENELTDRSNTLYQQAFAYRRFLDPAHLEDYVQIVKTIWEPAADNQSSTLRTTLASGKGKQPEYRTDTRINIEADPLAAVGRNFLDDLEQSVVTSGLQRPLEVSTSELWTTHFTEFQPDASNSSPFAVAVNYIIQDLSSQFHYSKMLLSRLGEIRQRVQVGYISTARKLELAILQAGKNSLNSSALFGEFIPQVRRHCEPIYLEQGYGSRTRYQTQGVSLVETLIQTIASDTQRTQQDTVPFSMGISGTDTYDDFLENLHQTFEDPGNIGQEYLILDTGTSQQSQAHPVTTQSFHPTVTSMAFQDMNAGTQQSASIKSFTTSASHTGTPSESYTGSPDLSRPATMPTPPRLSPPGHVGASPKPISSTSQKIEANDACEICGYRPKGDPQWFKGSMAKHKKMQHSTGPPVIYKCPYPGCNSQYKNRQDNLRQHQIEKNHFVGDEANRRPSKRKKVSTS
ncbi:hypothetical protein GGS26DRAFT_475830 [Hypomontagnella submonticulosa]|nr:hypothetical protein GGS26DRAFT_475830 [Hypomontagnella submonticulosa]